MYARYGTRSGHDGDEDVALEGLAQTMSSVLELHNSYPDNKLQLEGKQPRPIDRHVPEEYPSLKHFKAQLNYQGQVAKSCIHCHQVRDAARLVYREAETPLPEKLMFPFPPVQTLGLHFDKATRTTIAKLDTDSPAEKSQLKVGDSIDQVNRQLLSSEADFVWMLHHTTSEVRSLDLKVTRNGQTENIKLRLPEGWRKTADIAWRPTTWDLRRMATGGLTLEPLDTDGKVKLGIPEGQMALLVTHVGQYGNHARAKRAGIRKNDVIISFGGRKDLVNETLVTEFAIQVKKPGDRVTIEYLRNGKMQSANLKLQ